MNVDQYLLVNHPINSIAIGIWWVSTGREEGRGNSGGGSFQSSIPRRDTRAVSPLFTSPSLTCFLYTQFFSTLSYRIGEGLRVFLALASYFKLLTVFSLRLCLECNSVSRLYPTVPSVSVFFSRFWDKLDPQFHEAGRHSRVSCFFFLYESILEILSSGAMCF